MATSASNPLASGDTAYLYRAAIGPRAQDYYLRHFARFDGDGKASTSWNWAAYWSTLNWLIYRRMWGWALAYVAAVLGLALLIFGVGKLVFDYSQTSAWLLFLGLATAAFVVPGLYANAWYYTHCNEKITAALRSTQEIKEAATVLAAQAPDQRRLLLLALGNAAVLAVFAALLGLFQGGESALPQLAAQQERPEAARAPAPAPVAQPEPVAAQVASAPAPANPSIPAPAPAPAPAATPQAAPVPAAATVPTAPASASVAAAPAAASPARPGLINTADRAATAPRLAEAPTPAPVAVASPRPAEPAPAPTPRARVPRQVYVWVVQVGAYAQDGNAQNALAQVQGLGLEAGTETFDSPKGRLTRVRVGPFTRQSEAEQAALRIKTLNLPALVIRQRP